MKEQIGIRQLAKLANVSIGTIDRVLHKRTGVSKETEEKVLRIINETGYKKNNLASRFKLASNNKIKLAVLFPQIKTELSYWNLPKSGVEVAVLELNNLGIEANYFFFNLSQPESFINQKKIIFNQGYHGIITVPFFQKESSQFLREAKEIGIPVVFIDTEVDMEQPANFIRQNSFVAGKVAGRLLHNIVGNNGVYGIVNIVNDNEYVSNNLQRERGFRAYIEECGISTNSVRSIYYMQGKGFKSKKDVESFFNEDGIKGFFVTNAKAFLLPDILKEYKVEESAIVGFDLNDKNVAFLEKNEIDFLINQKPKYQGYAAVKGLFKCLTEKNYSELNIDIPVEIIVKENVG